jgi:hypothetical protein
MAQYLITYDNKPPRNYAALYQLMSSWKAVRLADSVWLANLNGPAPAIRDIVLGRLQPNDLVAVVELKHGADWAVSNAVPITARTWLSNFVTASKAAA